MQVIDLGGAVPVRNWAIGIEEGALEQAANLSNLPGVINAVALMPDAHQGYGMPIGGVLFTKDIVVPNAVGVDIGCGVALIETGLWVDDLNPERITAFLQQVSRDVPTGVGPRGQHSPHNMLGAEPYVADIPDWLLGPFEKAQSQLGTLGAGNHFLELQRDDEGRVWFMLHSGSRGLGKAICDHHNGIAQKLNAAWHSRVPDRELNWLPVQSDEGKAYMHDMNIGLAWAEENRRRMAGKVISAFGKVMGVGAWQVLDVHHNYAAWENHMGQNGIVHRKGAVRARAGEQVLIPGSMGTASYVGEGLGNVLSFSSCQHGAGRARSRAATRRETTVEAMEQTLTDAGVILVTPAARASVIDESPMAYKDIESVMDASADLVSPVRRHMPLGVVKG